MLQRCGGKVTLDGKAHEKCQPEGARCAGLRGVSFPLISLSHFVCWYV
jgi:hypothetical protein